MHPCLGFLSGWVSLIVGFSAPIAAAAMAMHIYLGEVIAGWPVPIMAAGTILLLSLLHAHDMRLGTRVQVILVLVKIALMAGFIAGVWIAGPALQPLAPGEFRTEFWTSPSYAVILIFVAFAYSGWNAASYIGAEIKDAGRALPRALIVGTLVVCLLYLLVNYAYLSTVPVSDLAGVEGVASEVARVLWGQAGATMISFFIAVGLIATVSAMIIIGPRVYEAMASDGLFPSGLSKLNRRGVPSRAVFLQGLVAAVIAVTSTFGTLLVYIGFTLNIFALLTVLSVFRLRQRGMARIRTCIGFPVTPLIFLVFTLWMTVWSIQSQPISALAGLATLGSGYLVYRVAVKKRKAAWRNGHYS
jgi:APA family basic amino acid/polyamine antiporter